jgi:UDP-N-acetylmuramoyl-tripeptide--D-alanyl-D-alanine ligase
MNAPIMTGLSAMLTRLSGARVVGDLPEAVLRVHTDTRSLQPGDLFVALQGERFDAHEFLAQAGTRGALAAVALRGLAEAGLPGVQVPDTRLALGALGRAWRAQFAIPLVAVTGSNGKTTVTQMVASILRAACAEAALATAGNFNNDIGVPLTLLRLRPHHRMAVVELGMNHPGEIAYLADLARPTVALVNNAQREHQEFMASVEAVARENGSVISALDLGGTAVFPSDDVFAPLWAGMAGERRVLRFSDRDPAAEVRALGANGSTVPGPCASARRPVNWPAACASPAGTTCATRWPPPPVPWLRVCSRP